MQITRPLHRRGGSFELIMPCADPTLEAAASGSLGWGGQDAPQREGLLSSESAQEG